MKKKWNKIKTFFSKPYNVLLVLFLITYLRGKWNPLEENRLPKNEES